MTIVAILNLPRVDIKFFDPSYYYLPRHVANPRTLHVHHPVLQRRQRQRTTYVDQMTWWCLPPIGVWGGKAHHMNFVGGINRIIVNIYIYIHPRWFCPLAVFVMDDFTMVTQVWQMVDDMSDKYTLQTNWCSLFLWLASICGRGTCWSWLYHEFAC